MFRKRIHLFLVLMRIVSNFFAKELSARTECAHLLWNALLGVST